MSEEHINQNYQISDTLWEQIEPLLPPELPRLRGGRPRMDNRKAMEAIFYVFRNGCEWKSVPRSLGTGSTVYRRFQEWQESGLFQRMWRAGLLTYDELEKTVWYGKG
ncbi:transposase [Candidatus Poribacteria bacterium]